MKTKQNNDPFAKNLKIDYNYPDDLKSNFVSNMVIQHTPDHFIISFFEVWPPAIIGSEEEKLAALDSIETVDAKCISRIVVTPNKMKDFVNAMALNFNKYEKELEMSLSKIED